MEAEREGTRKVRDLQKWKKVTIIQPNQPTNLPDGARHRYGGDTGPGRGGTGTGTAGSRRRNRPA